MQTTIHKTVAAVLAAMTMVSALALNEALPPVRMSGPVEYLSGGIGKDEVEAMKKASKQWPLMVEFTVKDGKRAVFAADVNVVVRDRKGKSALQTASTGPLLLAKLTPGPYDIEATLAGKTLHKKVLVKRGQPSTVVFMWPTIEGENRS